MTYNQTCEYIAKRIMDGNPITCIKGKFIQLPTPQRAGTYTQQRTYAMLKAREIANNLKTPTT